MKKTAKKKVAKKVTKKGRPEGSKLRSFIFTGDKVGGSDPVWSHMHGYSFKLNGAAIKVKDDVAAKLASHSHFTEQ